MKTFLITGLVAMAMMLGAIELSSAGQTQNQCKTFSDYASMVKTGRC